MELVSGDDNICVFKEYSGRSSLSPLAARASPCHFSLPAFLVALPRRDLHFGGGDWVAGRLVAFSSCSTMTASSLEYTALNFLLTLLPCT
jgi:hypothetical protein